MESVITFYESIIGEITQDLESRTNEFTDCLEKLEQCDQREVILKERLASADASILTLKDQLKVCISILHKSADSRYVNLIVIYQH